jgi:hypothetical protein
MSRETSGHGGGHVGREYGEMFLLLRERCANRRHQPDRGAVKPTAFFGTKRLTMSTMTMSTMELMSWTADVDFVSLRASGWRMTDLR